MRAFTRNLLSTAFIAVAASVALAGDHVLEYVIDGEAAGDRLGHAVAGAGDVNGDGFDDFIAGAYYGNGSRAGYAKVYSGRDGKLLHTFQPGSGYDGFGVSVNAAGDVDGDGYDDVIVGAHLDDSNGADAGKAWVFSGKDGEEIYSFEGVSSGDRFGLTVNGAGDVDDDGHDDLIIGAYYTRNGTAPGYVKVYSGVDGTLLYTFNGSSTRDYYGVYVSGAGYVDDDEYADFVIGASLDDTKGTDAGKAQVISGVDGSVIYNFYGNSSSDNFGRCVGAAGDVNKDGYDDIVVGSYLDDPKGTNSGSVWVYSGANGAVLYTWYGDASDDRLGVHVDGAGDVDGDGYPDIVAGAYCDDQNGSNCGSARVFSGKDGSILYTWYGDSSLDYFGRFAAGAGDVNGDGFTDLVVGAYADDHRATDAGRVYVYVSPAPGGAITIDSGAEATSDSSVTLSMAWQPGPAGDEVTEMRFRDAGDSWGGWVNVSATAPWTLPPGDGLKTVEVQFLDSAGASSAPLSDSIILDQTPPTGSLTINYDYERTLTVFVSLQLDYTDLQSEVTHVQFRNEGDAWGDWVLIAPERPWVLSPGSGMKTVEAQFRDAAGNVSDVVADSIEFKADDVSPNIDSLRVNDGETYILPLEKLEFEVYGHDNTNGSGLDAFKVSFDEGDTWSDWYSLRMGPISEVERPASEGIVTATVILRDKARNESEEATISFFMVGPERPSLGAGAKFAGSVSSKRDVDTVELDLVRADLLNVKVKAKGTSKTNRLDVELDLVRPDGRRLLTGRYPDDAKKVMIQNYEVLETGRYLLVLRLNWQSPATKGTYKLKAKVKQAKDNRKTKGEWSGFFIEFEACTGSVFKASLRGEGLAPEHVSLFGPDGPVPFEAKGKKGTVKIPSVTLEAGTGTYQIVFEQSRTVTAKWAVKLPKIKGVVKE